MGQLDGAARSDLVADIYGIALEKQPCPLNYLRRLGNPLYTAPMCFRSSKLVRFTS